MPGYKLYYFNVRAKAEICRLSLSAANLDFEDIRLNSEEWAKEKASGRPPLGQMPFLVTPEGKVLASSGAIMKYICKTAGLCPTDCFDEAVADMIADGVSDLRSAMVKIHFEKDESNKAELQKEFSETTLPARLEKFSRLLKSRNEGKDFFFGDKLTYADITFVDFFNGFFAGGDPKRVPEQLEKFPLFVDHYNRVLDVPGIKAWIEKRPKTDF